LDVPGLAAASAVVVAFALVASQWQRVAKGRFAVEDVNHDGQIDILDAFASQRSKLRSTSPRKMPYLYAPCLMIYGFKLEKP